MANIGQPERVHEIEPLEEPWEVPQQVPVEEPETVPVGEPDELGR